MSEETPPDSLAELRARVDDAAGGMNQSQRDLWAELLAELGHMQEAVSTLSAIVADLQTPAA